MTKGLTLARAFYQAGHNVVGADFEPDGVPVNGRFSRSLLRFYRLSKPDQSANGASEYLQDLVSAVRREKVDLWVSCSGEETAIEDGLAKEIIESQTSCKAIQFDVRTTSTLHEKNSFIDKTRSLGFTVPETYHVTSRAAVHKILQNADVKQYIMKPVGIDGSTRGDMTLLPRPTISETYTYMANLKISKEYPWVLQQYIGGKEYCTHAVLINGKVKAFVACPSAEPLLQYEALPAQSALSRAMLLFTQQFAARYGGKMTGHLSFDFLVDEKATERGVEQVLYPIECKPRAHTAAVLLEGMSGRLADAYLSALTPEVTINGNGKANGKTTNASTNSNPLRGVVVPTSQSPKYHWVGDDLVSLVLHPLLRLLTGVITASQFVDLVSTFVTHLVGYRDPAFEDWDPLPWWWLYHVYWPGKFLVAMLYGRKWSRVNVGTAKLFPC